jgi:hypothetical protein
MVKELSVKGISQRRIANIMKIFLPLVNEDLPFLRKRARDNKVQVFSGLLDMGSALPTHHRLLIDHCHMQLM